MSITHYPTCIPIYNLFSFFFQSKLVFLKMADVFVSFAVQKLSDFLIQEVSLISNLRDEVTWLRNELLSYSLSSFLRDAELKQHGDQRVVAILETYNFEAGTC